MIFKEGRGTAPSAARFRNGLVVTQFIISIGLIICALLVHKQLAYMRNADVGFNKENLVQIAIPEKYQGNYEILKTDFAQSPNITEVAAASSLNHGGTIRWEGAPEDLQYLGTNTEYRMVDHDYIGTHRMEIVMGRDFSREFPSDLRRAYLINEEAVRQWNFNDPVTKPFSLNRSEGTVIGIYKNQHFGLKHEVAPCVLYLTSKTDWDSYDYLIARIEAGRTREALEDMNRIWKARIPDFLLEFQFVDDMLDEIYRSEERLSGLINAFTLLAVAISCLGLFGMTSFMAQRKTKEIGIRKVLGASASRILLLMMGRFIRWALIANLLAWPIAFYIMRAWLNNYPYRTKIGIEVFIVSGLSALAVAVMTVVYQSARAARENPAVSLKYE